MAIRGCNWPAVRGMRRRGLKVRKDGGRVMIRGEDYIDYLGTLPTSDSSSGPVSHGDGSVAQNNSEST